MTLHAAVLLGCGVDRSRDSLGPLRGDRSKSGRWVRSGGLDQTQADLYLFKCIRYSFNAFGPNYVDLERASSSQVATLKLP